AGPGGAGPRHQGARQRQLLFPALHSYEFPREGGRARGGLRQGDGDPSAEKRWNWVRRGVPLILEIGQRDVAASNVTFMRRDALRSVASQAEPRDAFIARAPDLLVAIQSALYAEAKQRLTANIRHGLERFEQVADFFGAATEDVEVHSGFKGWVQAPWYKPTGVALDEIKERLKKLKLTLRCAPFEQPRKLGKCIFSGKKAVEEIIFARAY